MLLVLHYGPTVRGPVFFALHPWATLLVHLNSLYSPIIYGLRISEFRRYFLKLFGIRTESTEYDLNRPQAFVLQDLQKSDEKPASGFDAERRNREHQDVSVVENSGHEKLSVLNALSIRNKQVVESKNLDKQWKRLNNCKVVVTKKKEMCI